MPLYFSTVFDANGSVKIGSMESLQALGISVISTAATHDQYFGASPVFFSSCPPCHY